MDTSHRGAGSSRRPLSSIQLSKSGEVYHADPVFVIQITYSTLSLTMILAQDCPACRELINDFVMHARITHKITVNASVVAA